MNRRTVLAAMVAVLATPAAASASTTTAKSPPVTVRVEGLSRRLLLPTVVRTQAGWITKSGAPKGECPARSAQGVLNVATHRRWYGVWSTNFAEYEITSILGETHRFTSNYFWEIFVNNVPANAGACELKLRRGEQFLFAAVPSSQSVAAYPTAIRAPRTVKAGQPFTVEVVWFNGHGVPSPLAGATVRAGAMTATTNSNGMATLTAPMAGPLILHAYHSPSASTVYVRAAPVKREVS